MLIPLPAFLIAPSLVSTKYIIATIFGLTYEDSLPNLRKLEASKLEKNPALLFSSLILSTPDLSFNPIVVGLFDSPILVGGATMPPT